MALTLLQGTTLHANREYLRDAVFMPQLFARARISWLQWNRSRGTSCRICNEGSNISAGGPGTAVAPAPPSEAAQGSHPFAPQASLAPWTFFHRAESSHPMDGPRGVHRLNGRDPGTHPPLHHSVRRPSNTVSSSTMAGTSGMLLSHAAQASSACRLSCARKRSGSRSLNRSSLTTEGSDGSLIA